METYIVYGKKKGDSRFKAFDMESSAFVGNLIHATIFTEQELPDLEKEVEYMNDHNPDYIFEIRKK